MTCPILQLFQIRDLISCGDKYIVLPTFLIWFMRKNVTTGGLFDIGSCGTSVKVFLGVSEHLRGLLHQYNDFAFCMLEEGFDVL